MSYEFSLQGAPPGSGPLRDNEEGGGRREEGRGKREEEKREEEKREEGRGRDTAHTHAEKKVPKPRWQ